MTPTKPRSFPKLKRGEGSWRWNATRRQCELIFKLPDGRRPTVRGDNPLECLTKRQAMLDGAAEQLEVAAKLKRGDGTVGQMMEGWFAYHAGAKAPCTRDSYVRAMAHIRLTPMWGQVARTVTRGDIQNLLLFMVDHRDLGHSACHKIRTHLRQAFEYGEDHGFVLANPAARIKLPGHVRKPSAPVWLDHDGFVAMRRYLAARPSAANVALLTGLLTGLRPGEVLAIGWDRLDLGAGELRVARNLQRSQMGRVTSVVDELKNGHSERVVQLPRDLVVALRAIEADRRVRKLAAEHWDESGLVFVFDDGRTLRFSTLQWWCTQACAAIGVPKLSPNKLRHSHASTLLDRGVPMADVARQLGHKDMRMVMTTYGHAMRPQVETATVLALES